MQTQPFSLTLAALAVFFALLCQSSGNAVSPPTQHRPQVSWLFDMRRDRSANPHTSVFLRVRGRRVPVLHDAGSEFQVVERQDYPSHSIPAQAVAACSGWWAGQGEDLYVILRGDRLIVFHRALDEEAPIPAFTRLKTISIR